MIVVEINDLKNDFYIVASYKYTQLIFPFPCESVPGLVKICDTRFLENSTVYTLQLKSAKLIQIKVDFTSTDWGALYASILEQHSDLEYYSVVKFVSYYFPKFAKMLNDNVLSQSPSQYLENIMKEQGYDLERRVL
jgi:hypothetical protein